MKKLAIIILAALIALSLVACATKDNIDVSANDYAADANTYKIATGTLTFEIYTGDSVRITDYVGIYTDHVIEIPQIVKSGDVELTVEVIGKEAFYYCAAATSIILPETVAAIEDWAFAGCTSLETIVIPKNVTSIGKGAFNGCVNLKSVIFEDGSALETIGDHAFNDCSAIETITLPEGLKNIGVSSFRDCESITSLKTPASLETIGDMAFYGCTGLNAPEALDLSASVNIKVSTVTNANDEEIEVIAIGQFVFTGIYKSYIVVPADENSAIAKYVAAMKDPNEVEIPEEDTEAADTDTAESEAESETETA